MVWFYNCDNHITHYRLGYQGILLISYGLLYTWLQNKATEWLVGKNLNNATQVHLLILLCISGPILWAIIYLIIKTLKPEQLPRRLTLHKFLKTIVTAIADLATNILLFVSIFYVQNVFANYVRGFVLPVLAMMHHCFIRDKLRKHEKAGAIITFIGVLIAFITTSIYYINSNKYPGETYGIAVYTLGLYVIFQSVFSFSQDILSRNVVHHLDFQPREIIAYLGIWEYILGTIILVLLNNTYDDYRLLNTPEIIEIVIDRADPYLFAILAVLPFISVTYYMLLIRIIQEQNAGTSVSFEIIRSVIYFLVVQTQNEMDVVYTVQITIGAIFIIYGCLIFINSPITPTALSGDLKAYNFIPPRKSNARHTDITIMANNSDQNNPLAEGTIPNYMNSNA